MVLLARFASATADAGSTVTVGAVADVHAGPVNVSLTVRWEPSCRNVAVCSEPAPPPGVNATANPSAAVSPLFAIHTTYWSWEGSPGTEATDIDRTARSARMSGCQHLGLVRVDAPITLPPAPIHRNETWKRYVDPMGTPVTGCFRTQTSAGCWPRVASCGEIHFPRSPPRTGVAWPLLVPYS